MICEHELRSGEYILYTLPWDHPIFDKIPRRIAISSVGYAPQFARHETVSVERLLTYIDAMTPLEKVIYGVEG